MDIDKLIPLAVIVFVLAGAVALVWHLASKADTPPSGGGGGSRQKDRRDPTRRD